MSIFYIYKTTNLLNNKNYIGKRKCPLNKTPLEDSYLGSGILLKEAIKKYGKENFIKTILEDHIDNEYEASVKEIHYIQIFKEKREAQYNLSPGGENLPKEYLNEKDQIIWGFK